MWYRDEQLAAFRIAELRAEADRMRFETRHSQVPARSFRSLNCAARRMASRLVMATRRGPTVIARTLDATTGRADLPAGMFGGQGHNR